MILSEIKKCFNYQLNYVMIMTAIIMIYDDYVKFIYYNVLCNTIIHLKNLTQIWCH